MTKADRQESNSACGISQSRGPLGFAGGGAHATASLGAIIMLELDVMLRV